MANDVVPIANSKTQRPSSSAFKQQKLPAWQPILTAGTVLPTFFLIGVAFIPIGIGLLVSSNQVHEYSLNYTACQQYFVENDTYSNRLCAEVIANVNEGNRSCRCRLNFILENSIKKDVYVYYGLTNYYQNHRRYVKSRDDRQLLGENRSLSSDCEPYMLRLDMDGTEKPIAPCGAIANSLFNDTFRLEIIKPKPKGKETVPLLKEGIAWATDKRSKFRNPPLPSGTTNLSYAFVGSVRPYNWLKDVWRLNESPDKRENNGYEYEPFIVWMRTAALPTFRKIYARVRHDADYFTESLPKGNYSIIIDYNYPVVSFKGTKHIILSNTSWLGGKNPFIGISYIIVGSICLVLSAAFAFIHKKFGKSTSEMLSVTQRTSFNG